MGARLLPVQATLRVPSFLIALGLACGLGAATLPGADAEDALVVKVDQALIAKVPPGTQTLVIGNPMIADVTLLKSGDNMVITGKGFGETNFIALDAKGAPVEQKEIRVVAASNGLIVQRGMERESYTCAPRCQPTARLGDDTAFFKNVADQIDKRNKAATQ